MAAELLLDTGPFVALVDRSEARHVDCVAALEGWSGPVVTTEAKPLKRAQVSLALAEVERPMRIAKRLQVTRAAILIQMTIRRIES